MYIITGLGNPGLKYAHTHHNAGFDAIDHIAKKYGISVKKKEHRAITGTGTIDGHKVLLVKPQTFMNSSGEALLSLCDYYGADPEKDLIVLSDDIMLPVGKMRIRRKGSAGGHNGLKSIIKLLKTEEFMRIRLGVGDPEPGDDLINHVLKKMSKEERKTMEEVYENVSEAVKYMMNDRIDEAMNHYN